MKPDGHWREVPRLRDELDPERIIGGRQLWHHALDAIEQLPAGQRAVLILRDMEGREAEEICALLEISAETSACSCIGPAGASARGSTR